MGVWPCLPGEFSDEGYFDDSYPAYVKRAFIAVHYEDIDEANRKEGRVLTHDVLMLEAMRSFEARWGGLSDDSLLRALEHGTGPDRLVAIFAIGQSELPDLVFPFLESANQLERCATAIVLTLQHDERGLPALEEYLLHDPPPDEKGRYRFTPDASWYECYYGDMGRVLANWGPASLTPLLKQTFLRMWEKEKQEGAFWSTDYAQDAMLYALGKRGALSALHGIALPEPRRRLAMTFLALGHLRADERFADIFAAMREKKFQREVALVLFEFFALSEQESLECVRSFGLDHSRRRAFTDQVWQP